MVFEDLPKLFLDKANAEMKLTLYFLNIYSEILISFFAPNL